MMKLMDKILKDNDKIWETVNRCFPLLRSITGEGVRKTHNILSEIIPLNRIEIPTGKKIYDWTIPEEWVIKEAYVIEPSGNKILDIKSNNLHILNYSIGFKGELSLEELNKHLYSLPEQPEAIPYMTSYYSKKWGFCISDNERKNLKEGKYKVFIDASHIKGSLTISDCILEGESKKEILISSYTCHPSMGNNELSGPIVLAYLYKHLSKLKNRYFTYRFVLCPETIGAIAYLNKYEEEIKKNVIGGFVLSCIGDKGGFTFKGTKRGDTIFDKAGKNILKLDKDFKKLNNKIYNFWPSGSDERQYNSPGFNLNMCGLSRTIYGGYKEYHTSLDDLEFIDKNSLAESVLCLYKMIMNIEKSFIYKRTQPHGEPFFSKYGLYKLTGASKKKNSVFEDSLKWLCNYCDSTMSLLDIVNITNTAPRYELVCQNTLQYCDIMELDEVVKILLENKILIKVRHEIK